ncbi:polysaccharide pyruvyl transferase family protein [Ornithinimicrobium cryptoxanthini]|uniref:polysaccharide pyruvyl transferase family protein n=1 Tax=Ornithinimicrobium cryptoxanthini TaxID=2934161 RepID=UPI00351C7948
MAARGRAPQDACASRAITSWRARFGSGVTFNDVTRRPEAVIAQISRCEEIMSTSLHGVVIAASYGIPAAWGSLSAIEGRRLQIHRSRCSG